MNGHTRAHPISTIVLMIMLRPQKKITPWKSVVMLETMLTAVFFIGKIQKPKKIKHDLSRSRLTVLI